MVEPNTAKILRVDLGERRLWSEDLESSPQREYLGGSGLGAWILEREITAPLDPFSPENPLMFMVGPLTGIVPLGSRYAVCALSPATGGWGEARSGGTWPTQLRRSGFMGIVIQGRARDPVYLYINGGRAELKDAGHLWGRDTYTVSDLLLRETDARASVAAIGPAGENLVRMAGIINDGRQGRAAARGGMGAVMGSKNLKAIVIRGAGKPPVADEPRLKAATREFLRKLTRMKAGEFGPMPKISSTIPRIQDIGCLPVKNWTGSRFESFVEEMSGFEHGPRLYCHSCPIGCHESYLVPGDDRREMTGHHLLPLGPNCLIDDLEALQEAYDLCNTLGMDSISVGACISFAMECYERGLITRSDTDGVELTWGNAPAMLEMVKRIGEAQGFGRVLGQGVKRAAEEIGGQAHLYAMHVKGLEMPVWDPRVYNSLWVGLSTANMGPNHMESRSHVLERESLPGWAAFSMDGTELGHPPGIKRLGFHGKADMVKKMQDMTSLMNALIICDFAFTTYGLKPSESLEWLNAATGFEMSFEEYLATGARIFDRKRRINLRQGLTAADDMLPQRYFTRRPGVDENICESLPGLLQEYYALRGWSADGVPPDGPE